MEQFDYSLHKEMIGGSVEDVKKLIEKGIDVNGREPDSGLTPLHYAAFLGKNPAIITELVKHGANIEARNNEGRSPIFLAVLHEKIDNVKELLNCGCNTNSVDSYGDTPLHIPVLSDAKIGLKCTQLLLQHGANVNFLNRDGESVLQKSLKHMFHDDRLVLKAIERGFIKLYVQYLALHSCSEMRNMTTDDILKYCLGQYWNESGFALRAFILVHYSKSCLMMQICLADEITLYQFLMTRCSSIKNKRFESPTLLKKFIKMYDPKRFKNFNALVLDTINKKDFEYFTLFLNAPCNSAKKYVILNGKILFKIGKYLSNDDLFSFLQCCT